MSETLNRGTGLILIEAINSNPNGDPDRENDPRTRQDGRGEISPVSFKHKLRDLVANKEGSIWKELSAELDLSADEFLIMEHKDTVRADVKKLSIEDVVTKYWDVRVFGATFLEEKSEDANTFIRTGVAQFGLGVSLSPVRIERMTTTKVLPVEDDKSKGMAPLAFRIVSYGLYAMPFFINATAAQQTSCTKKDIQLLLRLIPFAYTQSASYLRPQVNIRHAFYIEHNRPRGTFSDFKMIDALTPAKRIQDSLPATSWRDYDETALLDNIASLNDMLTDKAAPVIDLMDQL